MKSLIIASSAATLLVLLRSPTRSQSFSPTATRTTKWSGGRKEASLLFAESSSEIGSPANKKKKFVVIGGGWAGFSAADALSTSQDDIEVTLLDASPRGSGGLAGGWRTPQGRSVEAGLHGFWRDYANTFCAIERLGLELDDVLTPYTPSMLVSESGKVAVAPVLGQDETTNKSSGTKASNNKSKVFAQLPEPLQRVAQLLPPPLDIALLSDFEAASPLSLLDRISAIGALGVWADFGQEDPASWKRYDDISAETLFLATCGVTPALYRELVTPLLHVLPMTPGYDCSAAAALSCFHVFALQSKGAFDVRWCRGTISETIFNPWTTQLATRGVEIRGSSKVTSITSNNDNGEQPFEVVVNDNPDETIQCDGVILAVGGTAMKRLVPQCPALNVKFDNNKSYDWNKVRGVTCVAVRLFLKELPGTVADAMQESPVVVCGPRVLSKELAETGFCIYDVQRLQDEFKDSAALEVDFFRADAFVDMDDAKIIDLTMRAVAAALNIPELDSTLVIDSSVVRARQAVSHFCVGSASTSPPVKLRKGLYMCGDWIDRTGHASWSTEKAVVTGRQAVQSLQQDFGLRGIEADIVEVPKDSPQLAALRRVSQTVRPLVPNEMMPVAPWKLLQQLGLGRR